MVMTMDQSKVRRTGEEPISLHLMTHVYDSQVDAFERDAFEVHRLAGYIKNTFAPANRVPPEVLSTIPEYCPKEGLDQTTIRLSHVCRHWRDTFTSRPSLWTNFSFKDIDKTRTYIQRSQSFPLTFNIDDTRPWRIGDAFPPIILHIRRLKSLTIRGAKALPEIIEHFRCHTPLLEHLDISSEGVLDGALFDGDLSSLRKLRLNQVITQLPWKYLANLRVVKLRGSSYGVTQILDFFESAPFLHTISLGLPELPSSDAPLERIVPLRHLKDFTIDTETDPLTLLHHLHIPVGSSLNVDFILYDEYEESPLPDYLSRRSTNFSNLSDATAINLNHDYTSTTKIQLSGPSGRLCLSMRWRVAAPYTVELQSYRFLDPFLSTTRRLTILEDRMVEGKLIEIEDCPISQTLSSADNIRTLVLYLEDCDSYVYIRALDPEQNPSNVVPCPNMEELVFYLRYTFMLNVNHLVSLAKNRASRGARISSVTIVDVKDSGEEPNLSRLREYVTHVKWISRYIGMPCWDLLPGDADDYSMGNFHDLE
jgi:hypothetical protein